MAQKKANRKTATSKKTTSKKAIPKRTTRPKNPPISNDAIIYGSVAIVVAVFLAIFIYINIDGGILSNAIRNVIAGGFGIMAYFLPILIAGVGIYSIVYKSVRNFWFKLLEGIGLLISVGAMASIIAGIGKDVAFSYNYGIDNMGGGVLGTAISAMLIKLLQVPATVVLLILLIILFANLITNVPIYMYIGKGFAWLYNYIKDMITETIDNKRNSEDMTEEEKPKRRVFEKPEEPDLPEHNTVKKGKPAEQIEIDDGIEEVFSEIRETKPEIEKKKRLSFKLTEKEIAEEFVDDEDIKPEVVNDEEFSEEAEGEEQIAEKVKNMTDKEKAAYLAELDEAIAKEKIEYVVPDIELLNTPAEISTDGREELRKTAEKLITTLGNFGVKARLLQVTQGPTVTRFEIQPDTGIKLSKIVGLADDIALNLAVQTVLVAPVPNKAAVGIEIPNAKVSTVSIREILDSDEFKNAKSKLTVALGKDIGGNVVVGDIAKMPHVLIAGATGSGKSVCINSIVMSILYKAKPDEVKLIMVDPKVVELGVYNGIPHLLIPVVTDPKKAAGALNWAVSEMMRRYEMFKEAGVKKMETYNQHMEQTGGEKMPNLVIIIDELADLMMVAAKEVEDYICRLAQLARAAGIHLIIATQRPSVDVITGLIKANVPSRIAFAVSSQVDSRTILDKAGADKLLGMGDMLYSPAGSRSPSRVQGAFVSEKEIDRVLEFIKDTTGDTHYSEDLAEQIERCALGENGVTPDADEEGDALLPEAISLAVELGKISTSMVQRRLGVGYARAGRIIDQMEARGIISGANGSKPRDVLVSHADMPMMNSGDEYDEE